MSGRFTITLLIGLTLVAVGHAYGASEVDKQARGFYVEGQKAYKLGHFLEAARFFEEAYNLSPRAALLWDVASSLDKQFEIDGDVTHLKRARFLYMNFMNDPSTRPEDRRETDQRLTRLDELIASAPPRVIVATGSDAPTPSEPGSGKRLAGLVLAGVGVAAIVGGAVFGVLGNGVAADLSNLNTTHQMYNPQWQSSLDRDRALEGTFIGVGVAALAAGVVVYLIGNHERTAPATALLDIGAGRALAGLSVRF